MYGCSTNRTVGDNNPLYSIYKIDSINSYYLIYAEKQDSFYKIVSKKENINSKCDKISLNKKYKFKLHSIWDEDLYINGVNVGLRQTPRVNCIEFEENTVICLERDSINDLYQMENLKGLCIVE